MYEEKSISVTVDKENIKIDVGSVLYVVMERNNACIHMADGRIYTVRMTLTQLQEKLGDNFILIHRSVLVSAMAIYKVGDKIYLNNGEGLDYVIRKKRMIQEQLLEKQKRIIGSFSTKNIPRTRDEYEEYYRSFDYMPFAFTDIEMVFNDEKCAVDWIFRYGNNALAKLEKLPLDKLIGSSFGTLFSNMDSKWLRSYERATLYDETMEIIDYSPEIDTYLKVICFPTFKGHCGCILFNISDIEFTRNSNDAEKALLLYFGRKPHVDSSH